MLVVFLWEAEEAAGGELALLAWDISGGTPRDMVPITLLILLKPGGSALWNDDGNENGDSWKIFGVDTLVLFK